MFLEGQYTMQALFAQLGLEDSEQGIIDFIASHQLPEDKPMIAAEFWSNGQRAFLEEEWKKDAVWAEVIDELNVQLHGG